MVKETQVHSLGWEDPLEKEMATHSSILAWRTPWTEEPGGRYSPWGHKESDMSEQLTLSLSGTRLWGAAGEGGARPQGTWHCPLCLDDISSQKGSPNTGPSNQHHNQIQVHRSFSCFICFNLKYQKKEKKEQKKCFD